MTAAPEWDYIIVGSGAGGGTAAARLAEAGAKVLVLEAGGDAKAGAAPGMPEAYDVPAFHAFASEHPAMAWDFFVEHFEDPARAARDPKRDARGIFYPRAGVLGGCTAHNAMIFVTPFKTDWDALALQTGDDGWSARNMAYYQDRLERCRHRPFWRWLRYLYPDPTGHGWNGWLTTERAMPREAFRDPALKALMLGGALEELTHAARWRQALRNLLTGKGDINDARVNGGEGVWYAPHSTRSHARTGSRERLLEAARRTGNLKIELHALATRVLFQGDRAAGVEYLHGEALYRASPRSSGQPGEVRQAFAAKEVILAGGAFNTPQLLMLSGIGPGGARLDLPGVGANLQDRYELGLVYQMRKPWKALAGARFDAADSLFKRWKRLRRGMYMSNGASIAVTRRSSVAQGPEADLYMMALLAQFSGYRPGYSQDIRAHQDKLTWAILKARTASRGRVRLASDDPREPPRINFNYFPDGADGDAKALAEAVAHVRQLMRGLEGEEISPGPAVNGEALTQWVQDEAWGHHACGTCAIGPVLDSRLRVLGARGLRIADASIFPRIPGFFIASAVYLAAERAADMILEDRT